MPRSRNLPASRAADAEVERVPLLDVNVLVALAWPQHIHHAPAQAWFAARRPSSFATCPVTQSGFVRVSSNPRAIPQARSPADAHALLATIATLPGHEFWDDDVDLSTSRHFAWERIATHGHVTDAHLIAVAIRHKGQLVTLDRALAALVPPGAPASVVRVLRV